MFEQLYVYIRRKVRFAIAGRKDDMHPYPDK